MSKDLYLPKLFTRLRETLSELGWTVVDTDATDTFVVLQSPDAPVLCTIHYMKEVSEIYPEGTYRLKLDVPVTQWRVECGARPIRENIGLEFSGLFNSLVKLNKVLQPCHLQKVS